MSAFGQQLPVKEAFLATALPPKFGTPSWRNLAVRKVKPPSTIRVDPLSIHYRRTLFYKIQHILLRTLGEETFGVTLPQVKIANNRYCCSAMATTPIDARYVLCYRLPIGHEPLNRLVSEIASKLWTNRHTLHSHTDRHVMVARAKSMCLSGPWLSLNCVISRESHSGDLGISYVLLCVAYFSEAVERLAVNWTTSNTPHVTLSLSSALSLSRPRSLHRPVWTGGTWQGAWGLLLRLWPFTGRAAAVGQRRPTRLTSVWTRVHERRHHDVTTTSVDDCHRLSSRSTSTSTSSRITTS